MEVRQTGLNQLFETRVNMLPSGRRPRVFKTEKADIEQFHTHVNKIQ